MDNSQFKVGDVVIITKGHINWNDRMDKWVGTIQVIEKITESGHTYFVGGGEHIRSLVSDNLNAWFWQSIDGHYKHFKKKPLKIKIKF